MPEPLLTEAQVAAHIRVHPRTIKRWRMKGLISYERTFGGRIRYRLDHLIEMTARMQVERDTCTNMSP